MMMLLLYYYNDGANIIYSYVQFMVLTSINLLCNDAD